MVRNNRRRWRRVYRGSSYKGRSTTNEKLKIVAGILLVLVLLVGAGMWMGQRFFVYTDDGLRLNLPKFSFHLPFSHSEPKQPDDLTDISVQLQEPSTQANAPAGPVLPEQPTVPDPTPQPAQIRAVWLTLDDVDNGTALQKAQDQGANAIILDMKNDQGQLGYASDQPLAQAVRSSSDKTDINDKLRQLGGSELYLIARLSCFRDHALGESGIYAIETGSGLPWTDSQGMRWVSPASQSVREYLTGIMTELAQLGFDEIILDTWGFPNGDQGDLSDIQRGDKYDRDTMEPTITQFLTEAMAALEEYEVKLSVSTTASMLTGGGASNGRNLGQILPLTGRVWLEGSGIRTDSLIRKMEQAGMTGAAERLAETVSAWDDNKGHQVLAN